MGERREVALGVEGGGTAGSGGGDGLAVGVVDHVARTEDTGEVGPGGGRVDAEVALVVELQLALEELRARVVAHGDEQPGDGQLAELAGDGVAQRQPVELGVAVDLGDLAVPGEADLRVGEGTVLHGLAGTQAVAAVHDRDRLGEARQEGGLLHRGVATADHDDVLVAEEEAVTGGAPGDAAPGELVLAGQAQLAVLRSGGDDDGLGPVDLALGVGDGLDVAGEVDRDHVVRDQLGAEALRLAAHVVHELGAHDAFLEPGEVLHLGGVHQRTTSGHRALEHQRAQRSTCRVERGCVPGRAGADDDHVTDVAHCIS